MKSSSQERLVLFLAPILLICTTVAGASEPEPEPEPVPGHAIAVTSVRVSSQGTGFVVVKNTGSVLLRDVSLTWASTPTSRATFDPPRIIALHPGKERRVAVRGITGGRTLVTAGDKAGWARASRRIDAGARPTGALALRLTVRAPPALEVARPAVLQFTAECPAAEGHALARPAARLVLSLLLPSGVRTSNGEVHLQLDVPASRQGRTSRHSFAPIEIIADKPGPFRVRTVVRDANGRAAAGVLLDLDAQPAGSLPPVARSRVPGKGSANHGGPAEDLPPEASFDDEEGLSDSPFTDGGAVDRAPPDEPPARKGTEGAIDNALRWLAAHQSPSGGWEAAGFGRWCDGKLVAERDRTEEGPGRSVYDAGVTGLALCAFLRAGYTNRDKHRFGRAVSRGLRYLKSIQDHEGCFGPRSTSQYVYSHATCALAMVEAYRKTASPIYKGSAQRALDFIALARNPYFAWRYGVKPGDNDTSVSGWMMIVLVSARRANKSAVNRGKAAPFVLDPSALPGMLAWVNKMIDPDYGRGGYVQRGTGSTRPEELVTRFPATRSAAMTAVGVLARLWIGRPHAPSRLTRAGLALCSRVPPNWNAANGSIDMDYWYFGTHALRAAKGEAWQAWSKAMKSCALGSQRSGTDGCRFGGSWDPVGVWGRDGGRVYATALMAMALQMAHGD